MSASPEPAAGSGEALCLALRLRGPMQSWGRNSQYGLRTTDLMPSKSAVAGLCCAAMGADRGSPREARILERFRSMSMLAVALPIQPGGESLPVRPTRESATDKAEMKKRRALPVRRLQDFHTVLGTVSAEGKAKPHAVLTYRQYLQDALFFTLFSGDAAFLREAARALQDPIWGVWLGRKSCIPSEPVFAGLYADESRALEDLGISLDECAHERETASLSEGSDSHPDQPLGFAPGDRRFGTRRVIRRQAGT